MSLMSLNQYKNKAIIIWLMIMCMLISSCSSDISGHHENFQPSPEPVNTFVSVSESKDVKLPDALLVNRKAVTDIELEVKTVRHGLKVGAEHNIEYKIAQINGLNDFVKLDNEHNINESCISSSGNFIAFSGGCTLHLEVDPQEKGLQVIDLDIILENGQTVNYKKEVHVVDANSPKLATAPLVNSLDSLDNNIYFTDKKYLSLYNPLRTSLNNVAFYLEGETKPILKLRSVASGDAHTLGQYQLSEKLSKAIKSNPNLKGTIVASNVADPINYSYIDQSKALAYIDNLLITEPNNLGDGDVYKMSLDISKDLEIVNVDFLYNDSSSNNNITDDIYWVNKNTLFKVGKTLEANGQSALEFNITSKAYGLGEVRLTLKDASIENSKPFTINGYIQIAPVTISSDVDSLVLAEISDEPYQISIKNTSNFDWVGITENTFNLGELASHAYVKHERVSGDQKLCSTLEDATLKAGEACQLNIQYSPDLDSLTSGIYNITLKKGNTNLSKDITLPVKLVDSYNQAFLFKPKRIAHNKYELQVYNKKDHNVQVTLNLENIKLDLNNIEPVTSISNGENNEVTLGIPSGLHKVYFSKNDKVSQANLKYTIATAENLEDEANSINSRTVVESTAEYFILSSESLAYVDNNTVLSTVASQSDELKSLPQVSEFNIADTFKHVNAIHAVTNDYNGVLYVATDIKGLIYKVDQNNAKAEQFIYIPSNDYIQHMAVDNDNKFLIVVSFDPVRNINSLYDINLETYETKLVKNFTGSVNRIREFNDLFYIIGGNLTQVDSHNKKESIASEVMIYNPNKNHLDLVNLSDSLGIVFDIALVNDTFYLATLTSNGSGLFKTNNPQNQTQIEQVPLNNSQFIKNNGYINRLEVSPDNALYGVGKLDNAFILARLKEGQLQTKTVPNRIRSFTASKDALYYSFSQSNDSKSSNLENYISRWSDNDENNKNIDQNYKLPTKTLVSKLWTQTSEDISSNNFFVRLDSSYTVTEGETLTITPKLITSDGVDISGVSYKWNISNALSYQYGEGGSITITAPNILSNQEYSLELLVDLSNSTQKINTILKVEVDKDSKATLTITGNDSVTEGEEITLTATASGLVDGRTMKSDAYSWDYNKSHFDLVSGSNSDTLKLTAKTGIASTTTSSITVEGVDSANVATETSQAKSVSIEVDTASK
ncbi:hypothetical protein L3V82_11465, partial [Thiotrichales bacterium 19S3-7]|nr:hypothetical protein [Thiotrichales bacterium 19S3-7]